MTDTDDAADAATDTDMTDTGDAALFEPAGPDRWTPTEWSRGPWDPDHCHGGPVAALLARAIEQTEPGEVDWQVARLTVELTRPVPVGRPLDLRTTVERPGRRVGLVAAVMSDGDTEVARVRGLRIRRDQLEVAESPVSAVADEATDGGEFPAPPEQSRLERPTFIGPDVERVSFATRACEHRFAAGGWAEPGPVAVWIRLTVPVVPGEEPTGPQRTAAAADFGNGVSSVLPWDQFLFINPDLTVHLLRPAEGEWIGLRAVTRIGTQGAGLAQSSLHDLHGIVGRGLQSLFVAPR
jgi:hypothetical protein